MRKLLFAFLILSASMFAQTTCVNCGGGISALSDNGTNVTSTEAFLAPAGTSSLPSYSFSAATSIGMYEVNGNIVNLKSSASSWFTVDGGNNVIQLPSGHTFGWSSNTTINGVGNDMIMRRRTTANLAFGATDVNGVPVAQTISVQNAITGTDLAGSTFTIDAPLGTGLGAGSKTCLNRALMGSASGATAQTSINGFCIGESKKLSNTSATAQSLVNISVPSNSSGSAQGSINVSCNDGTNFDSETNTFFVSYVNKAGAMTVGTAQLGTASTANNSGSCTTAITVTAGTNSVDIKVTPVIGTIVPTTVTGTVLSLSTSGTGNPTYN